ncbi:MULTISPECIES: FAD-binding and (Fe-S)-binding domain-containing protein [Proteiniphilum]|jgi:D-lactate dehydrogenase|uniref:FAD-binding and (Fe-S)-binding domain-containing protein n=1 Tax=Proteiniphilum TaxID=294702 RepID=UPI001EEB739B|nr:MULTISPECIES: FAD-binding and (Fe-S)-binding domain-containing protein [Proteiniphilum]ULB35319.1 FAD-binding oxidoreductase [Proteiniphilum propionicum]
MKTSQLQIKLSKIFPNNQVFTDELSRLTKGTDAGIYRLIPKAVVKVNSEEEVIRLLHFCEHENIPVTFKGAGTSLSGQTISDSILMETGSGFEFSSIADDGHKATFGCGLTGTAANRMLMRYRRKIGPKPASIDSAKIGGIIANNASGSSYGIRHNSYNTVKSMRIIFADGSLLDTADINSSRTFINSHPQLIKDLEQLHRDVSENENIRSLISQKFQIKNTCGYGVNSLIDFSDPIQIIQHLMIGSEGTLGFVSQATFETVHDAPLKATAMIYFANLREVSETIIPLRGCRVSAAELMDRNALRAVEEKEGMPEELKLLPEGAAALLIDTSADKEESLSEQINEITEKLAHIPTLFPIKFTTDKHLYNLYWNVRNGLFTSAAATRPPHTACIIEDVAFRGELLGDALTDLRSLLEGAGYGNAVMWGHLLDGNVHFTVFPDINTKEGIRNYATFMHELCELVAIKYGGSLKAEHGTGRNMAPFVEKEWGLEVYNLMKRIKNTFDPGNILNPGVLINNDHDVFIKNLKQIPEANPIIDKCIECGFCEVSCPSKNLSLTPRQRIVAYRHLAGTAISGSKKKSSIREQLKKISYPMDETCATDGLCSIACPVGIDTGKLIKELRWQNNGKLANRIADTISNNITEISSLLRVLLNIPHFIAKAVGYKSIDRVARGLYRLGDGTLPLWTRHTPSGSKKIKNNIFPGYSAGSPMVVYFPTCITRSMGGVSFGYAEKEDLPSKILSVLYKAGYTVIIPEEKDKLCCGMAFSSKGFWEQAQKKENELNEVLLRVSREGLLPIVCDMSPCLLHMRETLDKRLKLYDQVEFIHDFLLDRLYFSKLSVSVAIHTTCSSTKMNLEKKLIAIASQCAEKVVVPENVSCCGWAGDRGFFYPELNSSALKPLKRGIKDAQEGYSNSRTCEIGLSINSGITYKSIVYLVDKATLPATSSCQNLHRKYPQRYFAK